MISIIIRTKDRPDLLPKALTSITAQTYPDIEVIVVNDGGVDIESIVTPFSASFKALKLEQLPESRGRSYAANRGLTLAGGRYIGFLDDDDSLTPEHINYLAKLLDDPENEHLIAAYGRIECFTENHGNNSKIFNQSYDPILLLLENYIPIHALLFRRGAIENHPVCRFDEQFDLFEDWDFWLQLQTHGPFQYIDQLSGYYRIAADSGEGVVAACERRSQKALRNILEKWHPHWHIEQIIDIVARTRFLDSQLKSTESAREALDKKIDCLSLDKTNALNEVDSLKNELRQRLEETSQNYENELRRLKAEHHDEITALTNRFATMTGSKKGQVKKIIALEKQLKEQSQLINTLVDSNSWRITRPMRVLRRLLSGEIRLGEHCNPLFWHLAIRFYQNPLLQSLHQMIPVSLKQQLRNTLYRHRTTTLINSAVLDRIKHPKLVSIIIPVYNHAQYLQQCIDSALAQTYEHVEVLICDDASPDPEIRNILRCYENQAKCRILYAQRNQGIAETQNYLLQASRGDIIAFLDCDDYLTPDAVALCLLAWQEDTVYLHTGRINIDQDNAEVNRIAFDHLPRRNYFAENLERMFATHFKLIRRDAFARVGLFDPRFDSAQDYDLLMRIAYHYPTEAFVHIPEFVYHHRLHEKQTTESMHKAQSCSTEIIQSEARMRQAIGHGEFDRFISIIMLSYGKREQTLEALQSLQRTVKIQHEIILFDNGSAKQTVDFIREHIDGQFANLQVIYHDTNLGPAGGRREALKYAKGEWFIIFDNDEIAEPGWLEELLVRASIDENVGAVCCKVIFPDNTLQFSGGSIQYLDDELISLDLYDRGKPLLDLDSAAFRDCDWCPIGATLFTENPAQYLHAGYPNVFEDAGVSMALRNNGKRLLNSPASWVWHQHIIFQKKVDMHGRYLKDRYNPENMLTSLRSFYQENGLIINDEYVWRENGLNNLTRSELLEKLKKTA